MPSAWFANAVAWIGAHPVAAGGLVFLVAFCDALAVVGIIVPALPLLFAVGALVGLGHVSGPYALACAALGALLGDGRHERTHRADVARDQDALAAMAAEQGLQVQDGIA